MKRFVVTLTASPDGSGSTMQMPIYAYSPMREICRDVSFTWSLLFVVALRKCGSMRQTWIGVFGR
jgi:hypothetical protein